MPIGVLNLGGKEPIAQVANMMCGEKLMRHDTYKEFEKWIPKGYRLVFMINDLDNCQNLIDYKPPEKAIYIFGDNSEDKKMFRDAVKDMEGDRVYIPTKMLRDENACAVLLYDRIVKLKLPSNYEPQGNG